MNNQDFIHRCLELAQQGRGKVGINPMVGAVLVRDGEIIAEAFHEGFGLPHAERALLESFNDPIKPDDILYVNLEPCCHHGKTPPCTDIIIDKGIKRIVYGMKDPNPEVSGKGIMALERAGIETVGPVLPEICQRLNRGFISLQTKGRPYITLKHAQTRSGEIANSDGSTLKITSPQQDEWSHRYLRARHDAILVGAGTVITDDPQLTIRLEDKKLEQSSALRIVLDPESKIPNDAQIIEEGTLVIIGETLLESVTTNPEQAFVPARMQELQERGAQVIQLPIKDDVFDWDALWRELLDHGISTVLVEGGASTWANFKKAGMIDEEVWLVGIMDNKDL
ncbi:MAG: bifunctional diaminohydroxyphosphoribosylaminopyrimidine deaminase/5-amino-6-(5-phosphoribosylamino)uracil reductase RibD [Kiritimatiellales bacterium]|nr:bifunctional diaminohydroxyphosphoribosylaminopyrimidine deaminase/5-amino-6-(5-phosphoribosylamino)uracil reductase RibD [Kiritimatiellales bacterium]